jgi:DNA-directed RNA polymerase subunit K/omega
MDKEDEPIYSSSDEENESESETNTENNEDDDQEEIEDNIVEQDDDVNAEQDDVESEYDEDDEDNDDEDGDDDDTENPNSVFKNTNKKSNILSNKNSSQIGGTLEYIDDDDDDNYQNPYLQKFNSDINKNYILDFHPECAVNNYDEISLLTQVVRDNANNIIDDLHKTIPFLTKYERTRVIGQRAKQINSGSKAFVKVPENVIDGYLIAELELMQKRIPFIIRRPTPGGGCEYWNLKDLEVISF